jgi:hypothetical protein
MIADVTHLHGRCRGIHQRSWHMPRMIWNCSPGCTQRQPSVSSRLTRASCGRVRARISTATTRKERRSRHSTVLKRRIGGSNRCTVRAHPSRLAAFAHRARVPLHHDARAAAASASSRCRHCWCGRR